MVGEKIKLLYMAENEQCLLRAPWGAGECTLCLIFLTRGGGLSRWYRKRTARTDLRRDPMLDVQVVDLTDETAVRSLISWLIQTYKGIDAALLLAGGYVSGGMGGATGNEVKTMFAVNFETAYNVARPLYGHMCGRGKGRIVLMGARPALEPSAAKTAVAYALSKSLLFKLAEILNADAGDKDVVTHVVVPSTIDTPNNRKLMPDADLTAG